MTLKFTISAIALFAAQTAAAATLDITYVEAAAGGYGNVALNAPTVSVAGNQSSVNAGGFVMNDASAGGLGDFIAWCLDLGAYLGTSSANEYETTDTPYQNGGASLDAAGMSRISNIFNANFDAAVTATIDSSAAFQLALWEAVYDTDLSIYSGPFQASASTEIQNLATVYLDAASSYSGPNLWNVTYLESTAANRRQNLVTVAPVPLPATGLMLVLAVGGLAAARRYKLA